MAGHTVGMGRLVGSGLVYARLLLAQTKTRLMAPLYRSNGWRCYLMIATVESNMFISCPLWAMCCCNLGPPKMASLTLTPFVDSPSNAYCCIGVLWF